MQHSNATSRSPRAGRPLSPRKRAAAARQALRAEFERAAEKASQQLDRPGLVFGIANLTSSFLYGVPLPPAHQG